MSAELTIPRGITRHEYGRTRGWLARVYRTVEGRQRCLSKLFSDGVYGGYLEALAAASHWQSEQNGAWPPASRVKRTPGYGYVQKAVRSYRSSSGELRSYEAMEVWFWDAEGRANSTSWSIEKHGEDEATSRCEAWLERSRAELVSEPLAQAG